MILEALEDALKQQGFAPAGNARVAVEKSLAASV
jgi:hypothetical protein